MADTSMGLISSAKVRKALHYARLRYAGSRIASMHIELTDGYKTLVTTKANGVAVTRASDEPAGNGQRAVGEPVVRP
jgi:hypothetical protein